MSRNGYQATYSQTVVRQVRTDGPSNKQYRSFGNKLVLVHAEEKEVVHHNGQSVSGASTRPIPRSRRCSGLNTPAAGGSTTTLSAGYRKRNALSLVREPNFDSSKRGRMVASGCSPDVPVSRGDASSLPQPQSTLGPQLVAEQADKAPVASCSRSIEEDRNLVHVQKSTVIQAAHGTRGDLPTLRAKRAKGYHDIATNTGTKSRFVWVNPELQLGPKNEKTSATAEPTYMSGKQLNPSKQAVTCQARKVISKHRKLRRIGGELYEISAHKVRKIASGASGTSSSPCKLIREPKTRTRGVSAKRVVKIASGRMILSTRKAVTPPGSAASAVQRCLRNIRARNCAEKAKHRRGLCLTYCRLGTCLKAREGRCSCVHDPQKVAVCAKWLQGRCADPQCRLQHQVCPELMPVCTFFLQGLCSSPSCPYLHVNVSPTAPPCKAFLAGYCSLGSRCTKRHITARMLKLEKTTAPGRKGDVDGLSSPADGGGEVNMAHLVPSFLRPSPPSSQASASSLGKPGAI